MSQHQSYWYPTVNYCPSTSPIETSHSTTVPVRVLQIPFSSLLFSYQSYCYDTVVYCPSAHPTDTSQSISALIPVLLIPCLSTSISPPLFQCQTYWYDCPLVPQYLSYWHPTAPLSQNQTYRYDSQLLSITSTTDMLQNTTAPPPPTPSY